MSAKLRVFLEPQTGSGWKGPKDHLIIKDHIVKVICDKQHHRDRPVLLRNKDVFLRANLRMTP